jgi:hypothetical protein
MSAKVTLSEVLTSITVGWRAASASRNAGAKAPGSSTRTPRQPNARAFAAFERKDFSGAIAALAPLAGENERIGGSRAQHDLVEFTLLRAYINANRLKEARRLLSVRRPGASGVPVVGLATMH